MPDRVPPAPPMRLSGLPAAAPGADGPSAAPRVLLIAPDPELVAVVREALEPEGLAVDWARGAADVGNRLPERLPDLVVLDVEHGSLAAIGAALEQAGAA